MIWVYLIAALHLFLGVIKREKKQLKKKLERDYAYKLVKKMKLYNIVSFFLAGMLVMAYCLLLNKI